jgi:large subunit ribosomal protein L29
MQIEKIRNLSPEELRVQQRDAGEQLFRLKFQLKMGQTAGVKKMRELRKDIARYNTVLRERVLGLNSAPMETGSSTASAAAEPARANVAKPAKKAKKKVARAAAPRAKAAAGKTAKTKTKTAKSARKK